MMIGAANSCKANPLRSAHRHHNEVLYAREEVLIELQLTEPMIL